MSEIRQRRCLSVKQSSLKQQNKTKTNTLLMIVMMSKKIKSAGENAVPLSDSKFRNSKILH